MAYDIVAGATSGNVIDGECHNVKVTGVDHTPTVTAPPGNKTILGPMTGTYNIGASQTFPNFTTITDAVSHLNNRGVSGPVVFNFLDAGYSASETFPITINQVTGASGTNTITFKPGAGVNTTISGSSATSIFKLNGADYVTFNGSNSGGTTRNLTISNTATSGTTAVFWIASLGAATGATDNTIKNCIVSNGYNTTGSYGIAAGGTTIASTGADNDNLTLQNNSISKAYVGIWAQGNATNAMDNLLITGNSIGSDYSASYLGHDGIIVAYTTGSTITQNTIFNIITSATTPVGLTLSTSTLNTTVSRNNINNITYTGTGGYGGRGLYVSTGSATSNLNINNNVFAVFCGDGYTSFSNSSPVGMYFDGTTGGLNIYYNSVYMSGNVTYSSATLTAGILFFTSTITSIDLRDNVFQNSMNNPNNTSAKNYAIYSATANTNFTTINYNDYYVSGTQGILGFIGTADKTTLLAWQTATAQDLNSISADPLFNSTTNLTPLSGSPVLAAGTPIAGITTDITGAVRSGATPSMGAYESGGEVVGPVINYTLLPTPICAAGPATLTATITDVSGVPTSGVGLPVLYYKKNYNGTWNGQKGVFVSDRKSVV